MKEIELYQNALDNSDNIVEILDKRLNSFKEKLNKKRINYNDDDLVSIKNRYLKNIELFKNNYETYIEEINNYFQLEKNQNEDNDLACYFQIKETHTSNLKNLIKEISIDLED